MDAERRTAVTALVVLVLAVAAPAPGVAVVRTELEHGDWRLATPLGEVAGPFLVVGGTGANWRCEIAVAEDGRWPARQDLLHRRGRGWTITATPDGSFVQPWSEPWRTLGPAAVAAFAGLLGQWRGRDAGPTRDANRQRWRLADPAPPPPVILADWAGLPDAWRPPGEGTGDGGDLRRRLTARGRGRGGDGLVLDLRWRDGDLVATSARWPGQVVLRRAGAEAVEVPAEAYLPLWPLAEFIR